MALAAIVSNTKVLYSNWFKRISGDTHKDRLQSFYETQADAYDAFRADFLHGRQPMLTAVAARLQGRQDLVWVDMGGGTGYNVEAMADLLGGLGAFSCVVIADLCPALCEQARQRVARHGWTNVHVVEADVCTLALPDDAAGGQADVITFSYSLSMIPPFHAAIDRAAQLARPDAIVAATDFYVSDKYDLPERQHATLTRLFWRSIFDTDGIYIGPERRAYLDHVFVREYEYNSVGHIPFVPLLQAPYYVWLGRPKASGASAAAASTVAVTSGTRPSGFPSTFIYSMTWEDPEADAKVFPIQPADVVLSLTSGGCNLFDMLLDGPARVVGVDMNPCQTYLVLLKKTAIQQLPYEDVWLMFGEGRHPNIRDVYARHLRPFLPQDADAFWSRRLHYFDTCMYYYGGMGWIVYLLCEVGRYVGLQRDIDALLRCSSTTEQVQIWERGLRHKLSALMRFLDNRLCLWFLNGVPAAQAKLLEDEGGARRYVERVFDQVIASSLIGRDNYFYRVCLTGRYTKACCPRYLQESHFLRLKCERLLDRLELRTDTLQRALASGTFTKVVLMDHMDWLDEPAVRALAVILGRHVVPGGTIIWRSASRQPWYAQHIEQGGFVVRRVASSAEYMDRVNMYASFYVGHCHPNQTKPDSGYNSP